jgi:phage gp36-like protein
MVRDEVGSTDERRQRYDDAVKTLGRISAGTMALGIEEAGATPSGGVVVSGPERLFSRNSMKGIF